MGREILINISLKYASMNDVRKELESVEGIEEINEVSDDAGIARVAVRCGLSMDPREEIYKRIKQHDWVLLELHQEAQTLEKVFRDITREN